MQLHTYMIMPSHFIFYILYFVFRIMSGSTTHKPAGVWIYFRAPNYIIAPICSVWATIYITSHHVESSERLIRKSLATLEPAKCNGRAKPAHTTETVLFYQFLTLLSCVGSPPWSSVSGKGEEDSLKR